jgi:hypothetical protein
MKRAEKAHRQGAITEAELTQVRRELVWAALNNAVENGHRMWEWEDRNVVDDLLDNDAELEEEKPDDLLPLVVEWQQSRKRVVVKRKLVALLPVRVFPRGGASLGRLQLMSEQFKQEVCVIHRLSGEADWEYEARAEALADLINGLGRKVDIRA